MATVESRVLPDRSTVRTAGSDPVDPGSNPGLAATRPVSVIRRALRAAFHTRSLTIEFVPMDGTWPSTSRAPSDRGPSLHHGGPSERVPGVAGLRACLKSRRSRFDSEGAHCNDHAWGCGPEGRRRICTPETRVRLPPTPPMRFLYWGRRSMGGRWCRNP